MTAEALDRVHIADFEAARQVRPLVCRMRFQLPVGLLLAVVLPGLYRWPDNFVFEPHETLANALVGAAFAVVMSYLTYRRLENLPGIRSGSSIFFTFSAWFALVIAVFFLGRLEYSRYVFASSYAISVLWFVGIHHATARLSVPVIAIVPGGRTSGLVAVGGANWIGLSQPSLGQHRVDGVVADLRHDHGSQWERFLADCSLAGLPVYDHKQLLESLTGRVKIEHLSENTFGSLLPDLTYLKVKQAVDFALAVMALPAFLIVLAVVGPLTVALSGWPVFFTQERMGYGGRTFRVYKFRTMRASSAATPEAAITRERDDRITAPGRFLRRYRIDELPQILNILKGEMSWIGPRPEEVSLSRGYEAEIPYYRYRHVVRPGISGWAQVSQGHVTSTDQVREKLQFDFFYIKHVSPWLDLLIVLKTLHTILTGFGSK